MKVIQEASKKLLEYSGKELRAKELNELGFNSHCIKNLMESGTLEKVSRGLYLVKVKKEEMKRNSRNRSLTFYLFKKLVMRHDFDKAYKVLMENYGYQETHDFDSHMRIYFTLLKELLGNYDFSVLDELWEVSDVPPSNKRFDYYLLFKEHLYKGQFYEALEYLDRYKTEEYKSLKTNYDSTILFYELLNEVVKRERIKEATSNYANEISRLLHLVYDHVRAKKYDEALECAIKLEEINKEFGNKRKISIIKKLIEIVKYAENGQEIEIGSCQESTGNIIVDIDNAINEKDYATALKLVSRDTGLSSKKSIFLNIIEVLLVSLSNYVRKNEDENLEANKAKEEVMPVVNLQNLYSSYLSCFRFGDYPKAYEYINLWVKAGGNGNYKQYLNNLRMMQMLEFYFDMEKNHHGFIEHDIDYSNFLSDFAVFNAALDKNDYQKAFSISGKITYNSTSESLNAFKTILSKMYDLDKKYGSVVNKSVSEKKKDEGSTNILKTVVNLTEDALYDEVYDRNYEMLFNVLKAKRDREGLTRIETFVLKLLRIIYKLNNGTFKKQYHVYLNEGSYNFKRFFEAISCEDIDEINESIDTFFDLAVNKREFEIYKMIVDDINYTKEQNTQTDDNPLNLYTELLEIANNNKTLTNEQIDDLTTKLLQEQDKCYSMCYAHLLNILYLHWLANNNAIDQSYFDLADLSSFASDDARLEYCINNGYYLQGFEILRNISFNTVLKNWSFKEKVLLKKYLFLLTNVLYTKQYVGNVVTDTIVTDSFSRHASVISSLLKKRDFYGAMKYVLENDVDRELIKSFIGDLYFLFMMDIKEEEELVARFNRSLANGLLDDARISILDYEDLFARTSIKNNEEYKRKLDNMRLEYRKRK